MTQPSDGVTCGTWRWTLLLPALLLGWAALATSPSSASIRDDGGIEVAHEADEGQATEAGGGQGQGDHHQGEAPGAGGGSTVVPWVVIALGVAGVALGVIAFRTSVAGRLVIGGVGVQLVGLGWDALVHARKGEPIGLFENVGHLVSLAGLAIVALTALIILIPEGLRARAADRASQRVGKTA